MENQIVKVGNVYRHYFTGELRIVVGLSQHFATKETIVLYQAPRVCNDAIYALSLSSWFEVMYGKTTRFTLVEERY